MISVLAALLLSTNATPAEIVASCRSMIPTEVKIEGRLIVRNRRGIVQEEHRYGLSRSASDTSVTIDGKAVGEGSPLPGAVAWSDLTLDYLGWKDFGFDSEREGESVHGQVCTVLLLKNGDRAVRVWVDRRTGALMQAEEMAGGECVRRLWGARIKKFGERWMANVMEVERPGSGMRTKITVEKLDGVE